ncbi:MAG: MFS transporter [Nitrososphaerales archaeon]|nr:MFS transporter [Nitrososphaerales archaeon]
MDYKWTVLTVTTVGVLMSGIDSRIVVIGLPVVASALHADAEQAIWFTQSYTIGSTIALLFIGRVSDMFGRVKIYAVGFAVFTAGSLLTSVSVSPDLFIFFRVLQGLGSAALFANSAAIITDAFPSGELGLALGTNQVAFRVGAMFGLTISGLILSILDWRFLFYINIPVGIFGTLWARRQLRELGQTERSAPMDWPGFFSFTTFITTLLLALTYAAYGIGEESVVVALLVVSFVSLAAFVAVERRTERPLLDLRLLGIREFTGGVVTQLLNAIAFGAFILLISLYLQLVEGLSPFQAGIAIVPFDLAFLLVGPLSGRLSDKFGVLPFTTAGLATVSISLYLFSTTGPSAPYSLLLVYLVICGFGMGLFSSPNMSSVMGSVPGPRRGVASGLRATFFNVGLTLSFNVVILVMTFFLPYSLITSIISSTNISSIASSARVLFADGLDKAYLVLAVVNTVAIIPSLLRGRRVALKPAGNSNTGQLGSETTD